MVCKRRVVFPLKYYIQQKFPFVAHPVQKSARDCYLSYGSNVLPNGLVRVCAHLSTMQVAHSLNFVKNDRFSPITLEKSTAGRGVRMRYL